MVSVEATTLTERQLEVLELRQEGRTQREVAEVLGTTASNVSAVERAAERNVRKARRTLDLVRTVRTPARFTVESGTSFDDLVAAVYARGDEAGVKIASSRPELYAHLYGELDEYAEDNRLLTAVEVGITEAGEVMVYPG